MPHGLCVEIHQLDSNTQWKHTWGFGKLNGVFIVMNYLDTLMSHHGALLLTPFPCEQRKVVKLSSSWTSGGISSCCWWKYATLSGSAKTSAEHFCSVLILLMRAWLCYMFCATRAAIVLETLICSSWYWGQDWAEDATHTPLHRCFHPPGIISLMRHPVASVGLFLLPIVRNQI